LDLKIQLFAALAQVAGTRELRVHLPDTPDEPTVHALMTQLSQNYPNWGLDPRCVRVAVNMEYAPLTQQLCEGDEIALIPPVSGG
jgi:molybdopterin converting factor subunit 1